MKAKSDSLHLTMNTPHLILLLLDPPVVDNDDIHTMTEKSGTIYLTAGKHPLRLDWFNQEFPLGLEVYYQGPDLPRQRIPNAVLFRPGIDLAVGASQWVNGLEYGCYEGNWLRVPDFDRLIPEKQGTTDNFNTNIRDRLLNRMALWPIRSRKSKDQI